MRVQRYIFGLLCRSFLFVLVLITAFVFLGAMIQSVGRMQDVPIAILLARLPYVLPAALTLSIPLAVLVGVLITYGRLAADNELLAIRTAGIHPLKTVTPALVLGLVLSAFCIYMNGTLAPLASEKARRMTKDDLLRFLKSMEEQRVSVFESEQFSMRWQSVSASGHPAVVAFSYDGPDGVRIRADADEVKVQLDEDQNQLHFVCRGLKMSTGDFGAEASDETISFDISQLFGVDANLIKRNQLTSAELKYQFTRDEALGRRPDSLRLLRLRVEYWKRVALGLACFVFALVGAPVGILFRKGSFVGAGFVGAAMAFVVYYPLLEVGKNFVYERVLSPELGVSLPGIVLGVTGLFLLFRLGRR